MSDNKEDNKMTMMMPPPSLPPSSKSPTLNSMLPPSAPPIKKSIPSPVPPTPTVELIYKEPIGEEWKNCKFDEIKYKFEVIKSGTIIEDIILNNKSSYLVGRLPICDIQLDHTTISRQHAVIQHKQGGKLYLYDLNSTHGSMINKKKCKPNLHIPLRVGDVIKFGESTRLFVLDGPSNLDIDYSDDEPLSTTTTTTTKSNNNNNNNNNSTISKEKEKEKEKSAFLSLFTSGGSSAPTATINSNEGWLKNDHDEEIRNHYKDDQDDDGDDTKNNNNNNVYDEDDLDNSVNRKKKKEEQQEEEEDQNDEFYDRTVQQKDKQFKNHSTASLIEKRKQFEIEKLLLQKQFKESTLLKGSTSSKEQTDTAEEDSLDQFMNENEQELKKNAQQKIMNFLIDIENQIKQVDSILNSKEDYKLKFSKQLEQSLKSIRDNNGIDLSTTNTPPPTTPVSATVSTPPITSTTTTTATTPSNNTVSKSIATANKLMFDEKDDSDSKKRKLNTLDNEIPKEYQVTTNKKTPNTTTTTTTTKQKQDINIKKLKQKQDEELVDLISRENNNINDHDNNDNDNRYGY